MGVNDADQDGGDYWWLWRDLFAAGGGNQAQTAPSGDANRAGRRSHSRRAVARSVRPAAAAARADLSALPGRARGVYPWYYPGPNAVRDCNATYVQEYRPSGTVIVPRMSCFWRRG